MNNPNFLQIHWLASYPATLLNRDDSGFAKRLPFGDAMRTRISSQCLKRNWTERARLEWPQAIESLSESDFARRSRCHFRDLIAAPLIEAGYAWENVVPTVSNLREAFLKKASSNYGNMEDDGSETKSKKKKRKDVAADALNGLRTEQAFILTNDEIQYLKDIAIRILKGDQELTAAVATKPEKGKLTNFQKKAKSDFKNNLAAIGQSAHVSRSVEAALFGRMVTSDVLANTDAAIHVAHAFTVHKEESESDYFTVIDDLTREAGEAGSAGLFDTELTAGLFYGYVVVDLPLLISNLSDDPVIASEVIENLIHLIATVSPGAKKGSTAPYAYAETLLIESGRRQPRTLANAFRSPVAARIEAAEEAMTLHLAKVDASYGAHETRRHLSLTGTDLPGSKLGTLDELAAFARDAAAGLGA